MYRALPFHKHWNFLHDLSFYLETHRSVSTEAFYQIVLSSLEFVNCSDCKITAEAFFRQSVKKSASYAKQVQDLHNHVNQKLNKPLWVEGASLLNSRNRGLKLSPNASDLQRVASSYFIWFLGLFTQISPNLRDNLDQFHSVIHPILFTGFPVPSSGVVDYYQLYLRVIPAQLTYSYSQIVHGKHHEPIYRSPVGARRPTKNADSNARQALSQVFPVAPRVLPLAPRVLPSISPIPQTTQVLLPTPQVLPSVPQVLSRSPQVLPRAPQVSNISALPKSSGCRSCGANRVTTQEFLINQRPIIPVQTVPKITTNRSLPMKSGSMPIRSISAPVRSISAPVRSISLQRPIQSVFQLPTLQRNYAIRQQISRNF